ncbi:ABC transporter permease subunit [Kineococcus glutinatus]|uniref:ABC transporter permease n=1 Tax=Kineococcus glutinatus TaxID=1070872 RepID=A0ABP9HGD0_9ACTN
MTSATMLEPASPAGPGSPAGPAPYRSTVTTGLSPARVARSEWIKLRTLRSTWITLGAIFAVLVAAGLFAAAATGSDSSSGAAQGPGLGGDPVSTVLTGANLAVLVVAVLGAVIGAREHVSGMVRVTMAAVPSRLPVLWGRLIAFSAALVPVVVVGVLVAYVGGTAVLDANGADTASFSDTGVARAVLGTAGYLFGIGLLGTALGTVLRSTAGAIGVVIGGVLILPSLAGALLPDSWSSVLQYLPSNAGTAFTQVSAGSDYLSPAVGACVFAAWVVVAVAGAAAALVRRDV